VLALITVPAAASAQEEDPCDDGGSLAREPIEVTPASGANGVTIDAPVVVLYSRGYFGPDGPGEPPETLLRVSRCPAGTPCGIGCMAGEGVDVPGTVQVIGDRLFFLPDGGLEASATYVGRATGVDDVLDFRFCTGRLPDDGPPVLGSFLNAEPAETTAACVLPEGGRLIGLRWAQATDDGPPGSIEYLLYLTRASGVEAPQLRDRLRNYASPEVTLNLRLEPAEAAEPVCVRVVAMDGLGNLSDPSPEQCFDPITRAAFQPLCAVRGAGASRTSFPALAGLALVALLARRRRHAG
jgi:MYXO-CTERM domain-containing protein